MNDQNWVAIEDIPVGATVEIFEDRLRVTEKFDNDSEVVLYFETIGEPTDGSHIVNLRAYRGAKIIVVE